MVSNLDVQLQRLIRFQRRAGLPTTRHRKHTPKLTAKDLGDNALRVLGGTGRDDLVPFPNFHPSCVLFFGGGHGALELTLFFLGDLSRGRAVATMGLLRRRQGRGGVCLKSFGDEEELLMKSVEEEP